ncbi:MAG: serine acetyltransferase [Bizionia sp.]|nr:serine acetyltransferase [Bizionia sp.]
MKLFLTDLKKYKYYSQNKSSVVLFLTTQGLWALFVYRFFNAVYRSRYNAIVKKPILVLGVMCQKWIEIVTSISLPYSAQIGSSFYIGHFGGIIINSQAIIGDNCNISQGVTIGVSGRTKNRGVPIIGHKVYIGANAVIAGKINIGDCCVVAANSLVVSSVPANRTVMGVPAEVVSENTSNGYI